MFLLDTDALSELEKPRPNAGLVGWLETVDWLDLYLSVITVAELWQGIILLPRGRKRRALEAMFAMIPDRFQQRIIPVEFCIAMKYGEIQAQFGPLPIGWILVYMTPFEDFAQPPRDGTRSPGSG
jgi:predicted nucleic acid-binding protein